VAKITGIGGVFLKPGNEDGLRSFLTALGVPLEPWGTFFPWRDREDPEKKGYTVLGLFAPDSDYFAPSDQPFMVNFRVDDLDGVLEILRAEGHEVLKEIDEPNGRFAHVMAPGGMKVELWEPADPDPYDG
jgi:predicted enzyme related to lactoylglutathione lyase